MIYLYYYIYIYIDILSILNQENLFEVTHEAELQFVNQIFIFREQ